MAKRNIYSGLRMYITSHFKPKCISWPVKEPGYDAKIDQIYWSSSLLVFVWTLTLYLDLLR